jgi:hypothetical protein
MKSRIVFTGDILRPSVAELRPTQHENIRWLAQLLDAPLRLACGLPRSVVHWDNRWTEGARLESSSIEAIYRSFGLPATIASWARIFASETLPPAVEDLFTRLYRDAMVIGFEIPPYLTHHFQRHGIAFVDLSLSPIRFMDDLLFSCSTSDDAMRAAASAHEVPEALIALQSSAVAAHTAKQFTNPVRPNSLLVILQTRFDKVVIENGRFVTMVDYLDTLCETAKAYDSVLIREHPLEAQPQVTDVLLKTLPQAQVSTENFYRLVGHQNLRGVAALSSSCVSEARAFGKAGHYLMPGAGSDLGPHGGPVTTVDDVIISADFWRDLLGAAGLEVTPKDGLRLPAKPNRFRQHLRSAWGYNQIDTDFFVQWAAH